MDTGAYQSSLHAEDIVYFKKGDKDWVRFKVKVDEQEYQIFEREHQGKALILKRTAEKSDALNGPQYEHRPSVKMQLCIDNISHEITVNLTDRRHFDYPMLLGRTALERFNFIIDPSRTKLLSRNCTNKKIKAKAVALQTTVTNHQ